MERSRMNALIASASKSSLNWPLGLFYPRYEPLQYVAWGKGHTLSEQIYIHLVQRPLDVIVAETHFC